MKGMVLLGGQDPGSRGNGLAVPYSPHLKLQESHREVRFQGVTWRYSAVTSVLWRRLTDILSS